MTSDISAEVILKSESGNSMFDKNVTITSENISHYLPKSSSVDAVKNILESLGFQTSVGPCSITIIGTPKLFEDNFKIKISEDNMLHMQDIQTPNSMKEYVEKIIFPEPVEYF